MTELPAATLKAVPAAVTVTVGVGAVVAALTVTVNAALVLAAAVAEATKLAVMLSVPTGRFAVVNEATPLVLTIAAPIDVVLLANVTVPLVTAALPDFTVAVKVTLWPTVIALEEDASEVVVVAGGIAASGATVTVTAGLVLAV